jgi:hypothetical protein
MELGSQLHNPTVLSQEKELRYQLDIRLGGPRSLSERCGEEKTLIALPRIERRLSSL